MTRFFFTLALMISIATNTHAMDTLAKAQLGKTLDCGYVSYPPALTQDIKTKAWSGFDKEFADQVIKRIENTYRHKTETNWGTVVEDLKAHKFDFLCSTYWVNPHKAKFALFTDPLYYQPAFLVVRADDMRFDKNTKLLNAASVKIAVLEGDNSVNIVNNDFPKATMVTLPGAINKYADTLVWVADGKADVAIMDATAFALYNKSNPGKLKLISTDKPLRIFPAGFVLNSNDTQLWHAFNMAIQEMQLDGTLERIMRKYVIAPHAYYPIGRDGRYIVIDKVK